MVEAGDPGKGAGEFMVVAGRGAGISSRNSLDA
jgi:hypothetical protein